MSISVKLELFLTYLTFGLSDDVSAIDGLALQSSSAAVVLGQCVSGMSAARYCCHDLVTDDEN